MPVVTQIVPGNPLAQLIAIAELNGQTVLEQTSTRIVFGQSHVVSTNPNVFELGPHIVIGGTNLRIFPPSGTVTTLTIAAGGVDGPTPLSGVGQPPIALMTAVNIPLAVIGQALLSGDEAALADILDDLAWTYNGSGGADSFTGGVLADVLRGFAGNDALSGDDGNDIIDGGIGADIMAGGNGSDSYYVDNAADRVIEANVVGVDHVRASVSFAAGAQYIENITLLGAANLNALGNGLNNVIIGNDGANQITSGAGNDTLNGGAGNDRLDAGIGNDNAQGGIGNDTLLMGDGNDTARGGSENDTVEGGAGNDLLYGEAGNDTIAGNAGTDTLDGGLGVDIMTGGADADVYYVDNAGDRVIEGNEAGVDQVLTTVSFAAGVQYIENIRLIGTANINAAGNGLNNVMIGNTGANQLSGADGNDNIAGGDGNDTLNGGAGIDALNGQAGNDLITGGLGNDTLNGGLGDDIFLFDTALNATTNRDVVLDMNQDGNDTIRLENAIFTTLAAGALAAGALRIGAAATEADDRIVYNNATGHLSYDSNGSAAGGSTLFAILDPGLALTAADFFVV